MPFPLAHPPTTAASGAASGSSKGGKGVVEGSKGRVIIMDEVDGMSGSDRGGIQELILMIKKSKVCMWVYMCMYVWVCVCG